MNFTKLVSSIVAALVLTTTASAQWAGSGSVLSFGVGGSYNNATLPNGRTVSSDSLNWGIGFGSASGAGYGMPNYGGGYAYPWNNGYGYNGYNGYNDGCGYNSWCGGYYPPTVLPYYGGGCNPTPLVYSPFTNTYTDSYANTVMYAPSPIRPVASYPQLPVCR